MPELQNIWREFRRLGWEAYNKNENEENDFAWTSKVQNMAIEADNLITLSDDQIKDFLSKFTSLKTLVLVWRNDSFMAHDLDFSKPAPLTKTTTRRECLLWKMNRKACERLDLRNLNYGPVNFAA